MFIFFFQAEDGIRDYKVTGVQTLCSSDLQYHIEKRRWMKCHEQNGRDEGADDDGRLHQQPIEPRTGHAEAHEQKDKYRRELTTWHMERIRQYRCEAACERSFQRMLDLP